MEAVIKNMESKVYGSTLRERLKLNKEIHSTDARIKGLKEYFSKDSVKEKMNVFESTGKRMSDAKSHFQDTAIKVGDQKKLISKQEDTLKLFAQSLTDRKYKTNPELLSFLKEHNTKQGNFLKRLFGIPKDPKLISRKDRERLLPLAHDKFATIIDKEKDKLKNLQETKGILEKAVLLQDLQGKRQKQTTELHVLDKKIERFEKPLKAVLEKVIDLDLKNLRSFMSQNNISVKSLIIFVAEALKNFGKYGLGKSPNVSEEKVIRLGESLKSIDKESVKLTPKIAR